MWYGAAVLDVHPTLVPLAHPPCVIAGHPDVLAQTLASEMLQTRL
jgi:hypothetical protein